MNTINASFPGQTIEITPAYIAEVIKNGLTDPEQNSRKHGNTPTEETRLKGCIVNMVDYAAYQINPEGNRKVLATEMAPLIQQWINSCKNIEELESFSLKIWGLDY